MAKFCSSCGKELDEKASFCVNCGVMIENDDKLEIDTFNDKGGFLWGLFGANAPIAGLMGIFLGYFGVHNFYLGYIGKAVCQLLITILSCFILSPISLIWGLIEGILIIAGNIDVDGKGNKLVE